MKNPILSICIISCNQRDLLKRCIESVLRQDLPFSHEIILSDDHSLDGTWDLIEEYCEKYPNIIRGYHCELDHMGPICISQRCALNKLNAYNHASGKYFVNLDADDYLIGYDTYKRQVALLDENPTCSLCQHRVLHVKDGENLEEGFAYFEDIPTGTIYPAKYLIAHGNMLDINQGFMMRRCPNEDMSLKVGKYFDDRVITFLHLLHGDCIFLNSHGYVYINYAQTSICAYNTFSEEEMFLMHNADILSKIQIIPEWARVLMQECGIACVSNMFKLRNGKALLPNNGKLSYKEFEGFAFEYFYKNKRTINERFRAFFLRWIFFVIKKLHIQGGAHFYKRLYAMATSRRAANKIPMEYWRNY